MNELADQLVDAATELRANECPRLALAVEQARTLLMLTEPTTEENDHA